MAFPISPLVPAMAGALGRLAILSDILVEMDEARLHPQLVKDLVLEALTLIEGAILDLNLEPA